MLCFFFFLSVRLTSLKVNAHKCYVRANHVSSGSCLPMCSPHFACVHVFVFVGEVTGRGQCEHFFLMHLGGPGEPMTLKGVDVNAEGRFIGFSQDHSFSGAKLSSSIIKTSKGILLKSTMGC